MRASRIVVGISVVLSVVLLSACGVADSSSGSSDAPTPASSGAAPVTSTAPTPDTPQGTTAQMNALQSAQSYLSMGSGFSEKGLLGQLTSTAADGYSKADAEWAVKNSGADWNAQALEAAKGYLDSGGGMSEKGLLDQLTSSAGSGFTQAQAEYAIKNSRADWNAQALEAAKGYMTMGGFSKSSLMDQLTSSAGAGFTKAQAAYAVSKVGL